MPGSGCNRRTLGLLGNRSVMDTPFNQTSYTAKLMQDQQARTVADVLQNDPSVRIVSNAGNGLDVFHIRGFYYDSGDLALNGLYGIAPDYSDGARISRTVEVLKGPSALLNGMPPAGAIGGSINLITKQAPDFDDHAADDDLSVEVAFRDRSSMSRAASASTRNSASASTAATAAATPRSTNQTDEFGNAVLNMDYRGERVRFSADIGYQADDLSVPQRFVSIAPTRRSAPPSPGRPTACRHGRPGSRRTRSRWSRARSTSSTR